MKETEKILKNDSIASVEKMTGKHWSEFDDTENDAMLLVSANDAKRKSDHLKSIGDTHCRMTWDEFKTMLESHGFEQALSYGLDYDGIKNKEEAVIYYHKDKGLILWATSFCNRTSVNGGNCYGEIKSNGSKENNSIIWKWLSSGGMIEDGVFETEFDVREGMFYRISKLEENGEFLPKWTKEDRFLWFVDWNEKKVEGYDYEKITAGKIKRCPIELQNIIEE